MKRDSDSRRQVILSIWLAAALLGAFGISTAARAATYTELSTPRTIVNVVGVSNSGKVAGLGK